MELHEIMHPLSKKDIIQNFKDETKEEIAKIEWLIQQIEDNSLINEQWFLDFLDKMNALSIKY